MSWLLPLTVLESMRKENGELRALEPQLKSCPRDLNVSVTARRETLESFSQRQGQEF